MMPLYVKLFNVVLDSGIIPNTWTIAGADPGGGGTRRAPPLKLEKIWFFGIKSWFFTRNTPKFFAPPSARRNFSKCAPPLTWNPGSAPVLVSLDQFIKRKDSPADPDNYRAITIVSNLGKLFTSILNKRLIKYAENIELITYV